MSYTEGPHSEAALDFMGFRPELGKFYKDNNGRLIFFRNPDNNRIHAICVFHPTKKSFKDVIS